MPSSPEALALAEQYRRRTVAVRARFVREFALIWPGARALRDPAVRAIWLRAVAELVRRYQPLTRRLALDYYRQAALTDPAAQALPAALLAPPAEPPVGTGLVVATLAATALSTLGRERFSPRVDPVAFAVGAEAAAHLALSAGRDAIEQVVRQDRLALGWMRITDGDPCHFCTMLASRGPVYKSAEAAGFELDPVRGPINRYHDNCGCQVVPVFTRTPLLPEPTRRAQQLWETAQREAKEAGELRRGTSNDALNALRRHMESVDGE